MPKIKIQIEADDDEFDIEDIENFLSELQSEMIDDSSSAGHSPWTISIINKNGSLTPLAKAEEEEEDEVDDDDDEWDDEHSDYEEDDEDDDE